MKLIFILLALCQCYVALTQSKYAIEITASPNPVEVRADSLEFEMRFVVRPKSKFTKSMIYNAELTFSDFVQAHFEIDFSKYPAIKQLGLDTSVTYKIAYLFEMEDRELSIIQSISKKDKLIELPEVRELTHCCINTAELLPSDFEWIDLSCSNTFLEFAIVNYFIQPRTDEEIKKITDEFIAGSFIGNLKKTFEKEEWLYAVCLSETPLHKKILLEAFHEAYPTDYRALNDLALIDLRAEAIESGMEKLYMAAKLTSEDVAVDNNIRVCNALMGFYEIPPKNIYPTTGSDYEPQIHYNNGIISAKAGDYQRAVDELSKAKTVQGATITRGLCKLLMSDLTGAKSDLEEAIRVNDEDAKVHYLLAIVYAREHDVNGALIELKMACILDPWYKYKAFVDLEFRNYWSNDDFLIITAENDK